MLWVKKGTHILDHPRFLAAGAICRDLYDWGLIYSGKHETDGELEMVAVLKSVWGAGGKANIKVAVKLVEVGLWERTDTGFRIRKWAEQGNQTKAQLDADRAATRGRIAKLRSERTENVRAYSGSTTVDVPTSTSPSISESRSREPEQIRIASAPLSRTEPLADDARGVFAGIDGNRPVGQTVEVAWTNFTGHHAGKLMGGRESLLGRWQKWVSQQAGYAARDRDRDRERADQDAERKRFSREGPAKPLPPTREESKAMAEQLAARVRAARAGGGGP